MNRAGLEVSVIVPTLNEADNLPLLVPRIAAALRGRQYEILVVDENSQDSTVVVCDELVRDYPVRLCVRKDPKDGLCGAVLEGMAIAEGEYFVVMDADLQHPPERVPALLELLQTNATDFVIGSRYVSGGSTERTWGPFRRLNSWVATFLARPFAKGISDPMSGFFALHRRTYEQAERLTPIGYKIGLELMCKGRVRRAAEVPIHFGTRARGESKLTLVQQFRYLEHLSRLYDFCFPRTSPILKFLIVLACGWLVASGVSWTLLSAGWSPVTSTTLTYPIALAVTAVFHARHVWTQREFLVSARPWRDFLIIAGAEWVACAIVATWVASRVSHASPLEVFLLSFGCATVVRYVLRKEFLQDIRGLRRDLRREDLVLSANHPPPGREAGRNRRGNQV